MNQKVDTHWKGSYADQEFQRKHKPITRFCATTGKHIITGYERIHLPRQEWFGTLTLIGPLANAVTLK